MRRRACWCVVGILFTGCGSEGVPVPDVRLAAPPDAAAPDAAAPAARWQRQSPAAPFNVQVLGLAYLAAIDRLVAVSTEGPSTPTAVLSAWTWDGATWTQLATPVAPSWRSGPAIAADASGVLVHGGMTQEAVTLGDTWRFDGATWTLLPAGGPVRSDACAASSGTGVLLFGGIDGVNVSDETWFFDGATWIPLSPATAPSARAGCAASREPATGDVVLFGGETSTGRSDETWRWDGTTWTQVVTATSPSAGFAGALVGLGGGQWVLYGGLLVSGSSSSETWRYDGAAWSLLDASSPPGPRFRPSATLDPARGRAVMLGGGFPSPPTTNDLWEFDGATWAERAPSPAPSPRCDAELAFAADRSEMVVVGGLDEFLLPLDDTWRFDGSTWAPRAEMSPPGLYAGAVAWHTAGASLFRFVSEQSSPSMHTRRLTATTWVDVAVGAAPPARYGHAVADDPARGEVVLFGGSDAQGALLADTWTWDGTAWTARAPASAPSARSGHAMAYDEARAEVVLFGGGDVNSTTVSAETWRWDGNTWHQATPTTSPPARAQAAMAYDRRRARVVLFGGFDGTAALGDLWTWDGSTWTALPLADGPAPRLSASLATHADGRVLLFGGALTGYQRLFNDAWWLE